MPSRDLRAPDNRLVSLAPFIVLGVMCHPRDATARKRMLSTVRKQTGQGKVRVSIMSAPEFLAEVRLHAPRGFAAGFLIMTYLQMHQLNMRASLNAAIIHAHRVLPGWQQLCAPLWSADGHVGHIPTSRRRLLAAFNDYLPATHLWAALLHGLQHGRADIAPDQSSTLPTFLGYADAFLELGSQAPWAGRDRRTVLTRQDAWRFDLPDSLRVEAEISATDELPHP